MAPYRIRDPAALALDAEPKAAFAEAEKLIRASDKLFDHGLLFAAKYAYNRASKEVRKGCEFEEQRSKVLADLVRAKKLPEEKERKVLEKIWALSQEGLVWLRAKAKAKIHEPIQEELRKLAWESILSEDP